MAAQDVFWVAGGSTANLLAVWRLHGLDELLRAAHARGAVLARRLGGDELLVRGLDDGLVRADAGAAARRARLPRAARAVRTMTRTSSGGPLYRGAVDRGELAPGLGAPTTTPRCTSRGGEFVEAVALREGAKGYRVEPGAETALPTRIL